MGRPLTYSTALSTTGVSDYAVTSAPPYRGGSLDVTAPDQVTNLVVTDDTDGTLSLAWDAEADAHIYRVYRGTVSGSLSLYAVVGTNSFADNSVSLTTYYYQVSAVDLSGNEGTKSAEDSALVTDVVNPTVALTEPNGGETLAVGVPFDIEYSASDAGGIDYVQAHYQINGGSWVLIDQDELNSGTITWTPDTAGSNVLVRVTAYDLAGNSASDTSDAVLTIAGGSIDPIAPDEVGSATLAAWWAYDAGVLTTGDIACDLNEPVTKMQDQGSGGRLMSATGSGLEPTLGSQGVSFSSENVDRLGNVAWAPSHQSGCILYDGAVAVEGGDQTIFSLFDDSSGVAYLAVGINGATGRVWKKFRSGGTITQPYTAFALENGVHYAILWMSDGTSTRIWIDGDEKLVVDQDAGQWLGDVPTPEGGVALGERVASGVETDQSNCVIQDVAVFQGVPSDTELAGLSLWGMTVRDPILDTRNPTVSVTLPNGGETLTVGQNFTIQYTVSDNTYVDEVDLHYTTNGTDWTEIVAGASPTGSYGWVVPNDISATAKVRVTARDSASNEASDQSDANFEIAAAAAEDSRAVLPWLGIGVR